MNMSEAKLLLETGEIQNIVLDEEEVHYQSGDSFWNPYKENEKYEFEKVRKV